MNILPTAGTVSLRGPTARRSASIFIVALAVRLALYLLYTPPLVGDAQEYYVNSGPLRNVAQLFPYDHWYQRTPVYMAFVHITAQNLIPQILLSALTCALLEILYRNAGWVFSFYPPSVVYANLYMKETLLVFLFVLAVVLLRKRKMWLLLVLPLIFSGFVSYGGVWEYNEAYAAGQRSFIHRLYILWRPEWHFTILVPDPPSWLATVLRGTFILVYVPILLLFLRKVRIDDFEFWLVAGFCALMIFSFGNERFREPVMPFIIGYVTPIASALFSRLRIRLSTLRSGP